MMNSIFGAYLENYNSVKLIIPCDVKYDTIYLQNENIKQQLYIEKMEIYSNERHLYLRYDIKIDLHCDYIVYINKEYTYKLFLGKITRSLKFEEEFYYDGKLGIEYSIDKTTFKIWTPVAKEVVLVLNDEKYHLEYIDKGVWKKTINKNLGGYRYYYLVRINDTFERCLDPYGISSSANNECNYVIDLSKTIQVPSAYKSDFQKPIIYEISFRDLCGNLKENDSAYLNSIKYLDYIKNLNITHIQIMPTFCFGGVDEQIKDYHDPNFKYNWGYNPVQYNIPSGWFSSDANNPYKRINEFKAFLCRCKELNLGVNLDVVYNHVYKYETFSLGVLVPGYVYRTNQDGFLMNSSYCGNDLRTEAKMVSKFIIDNLLYLQDEYKIDGFRFDLMGLIDVKTIETADKLLRRRNNKTMLYGEGWYMATTLQENQNANLSSAKVLYPVAFFNDYYRNEISGSLYGNPGFIHGNKISSDELYDLLCHGSMKIMPFKDLSQSINYIECHDNYTFFDKTKLILKCDDSKIIPYLKLGLGLVILSKGISFIHAGEELCRSKKGEHNSYNLNDTYNHIPWENLNTDYDLSLYLKNIVYLSKELEKAIHTMVYSKQDYYEIRYDSNYQVIINNNYEEKDVYFSPDTTLLFDGNIKNEKCEVIKISSPGIWILKK